MFKIEVLRALRGDSLIVHYGTTQAPKLMLIDGGPPQTYGDALKERLALLRKERKVAEGKPLPIDLLMISHIDDDHIGGVLQLVRELKTQQDSGTPRTYRIRKCWNNTFDDIIGNVDKSVDVASAASIAASVGTIQPGTSLVLASVKQGRELRDLLKVLDVDVNPEAGGGLIMQGRTASFDNLKLTVVAPGKTNIDALQKEWDKKLKTVLKTKGADAASIELAAYADRAVYNLASIVVLCESGGKRALLTGDARGDHTLAGLEELDLLKNGKLSVDLLKLPHHGSDRTVEEDYFRIIVARDYVISADGKHDNPDVPTLDMLAKARTDDDFTIHFTYPTDQFTAPAVGKDVQRWYDAQKKKGRTFRLATRKAEALSFTIDLG